MTCTSTIHDKEGLPSELISEQGRLKVENTAATSAFGELQVAQMSPVLQVTAQYGLRSDVVTANLGGSTSSVDSKFVASTGVGISNVSAIVSSKQATYRAGQGLLSRFTALFTQGKINSTQQAGFITSESSFAFGYNGDEFGLVHSRDGFLEHQDLKITTGATVDESAIVVIDGNIYAVPLTAGTPEHNAYEVSESLKTQVLGYDFSSVGDGVEVLAQLPDFGAGAFSFTSNTAVGVFTEIANGTIPSETWVKKADWNVNPDIDIDPTLGNVYQVQIQYLGFGGIKYYIENQKTANFELVHVIRYANTETKPSVKNPIFRIGWAARNKGNNTDIVTQGASGAIFVEGKIVPDGDRFGVNHTQLNVGTALTSVLSIQNRLTYFLTANRAELLIKSIILSTDTTKTAEFVIIINPIVATGQALEFISHGDTRLAETSTSSVDVSGTIVAAYNVKATSLVQIDINSLSAGILPGDIVCVAAKVSSGSASEMSASITVQDDL